MFGEMLIAFTFSQMLPDTGSDQMSALVFGVEPEHQRIVLGGETLPQILLVRTGKDLFVTLACLINYFIFQLIHITIIGLCTKWV